jgi:hypothetical protein
MNPNELAIHLYSIYDEHRLDHLRPSTCRPARLHEEVAGLVARSEGLLRLREAGRSVEGRPIPLVSFGRGERTVLLWSQMHGDEPTATLALADLLSLLAEERGQERWLSEVLAGCTVHVIPMLNPDGAERHQRHNAVGIDVNRDARSLVSPEARALFEAQRDLRPEFAFNLHDQGLASVGTSTKATAIALLAPAAEPGRKVTPVRHRAMRLASLVAGILDPIVGGRIASWDDTYEPRAFGDLFQGSGSSTLLIESGHWAGDDEKWFIRKLNFVALLASLHAIASGDVDEVPVDRYLGIPVNGTRVFDLVLRGVEIRAGRSGWSGRADVGLAFHPAQPRRGATPPTAAIVREIGDLSRYGGLEERDGAALSITAASIPVGTVVPLERFQEAPRAAATVTAEAPPWFSVRPRGRRKPRSAAAPWRPQAGRNGARRMPAAP